MPIYMGLNELFLLIVTPIALAFYPYIFLTKSSWFRKNSLLFRLCFSAALGISFFVVFFTLWAIIVPNGFQIISKLFFIFATISTLTTFFKVDRNDLQSLFITIIDNRNRIVKVWLCFYVLLYLLLLIIRPVIDSDVVYLYLPLARSITKADRLPLTNYYDDTAFTVPPAGGPVLFAFFYSLSGNIESESFRYITIPYFMGFVAMTYLLLKRYFSKTYALMGVVITLTFPFFEDLIFMAGLYPDIIFSFLVVFIIYILASIEARETMFYTKLSMICLGLVMAALMLLKYQALLIWIAFAVIFFLLFIPKFWKPLSLVIMFSPLALAPVIGASSFSAYPQFISLLFFTILIFIGIKGIKQNWNRHDSIRPTLYLSLIFTALGLSFIIRNFLTYGGLSDKSINWTWLANVRSAMQIPTEGGNSIAALALFFDPTLSIFYFIPKIIGFIKGFINKSYFLILFVLFFYTSWWVLYFGSISIRWLVPMMPLLSIFILVGLQKTFNKVHLIQNLIFVSTVMSFFSSKYIFWHLYEFAKNSITHLSFGKESSFTTLLIELPKNTSPSYNFLLGQLTAVAKIFVSGMYVLSARSILKNTDFWWLLFFAIVPITIFYYVLKIRIINRCFKYIIVLIAVSYAAVIIRTADGNLTRYGQNEKKLLYSYWGQDTTLVPYLKNNSNPEDIIIAFSPPTGLAYYTNRKVYNLETSSELYLFYPIFYEHDMNVVKNYFKLNKIRYVAIRAYGDSIIHFQKLKSLTSMFAVLDDIKFARIVQKPSDDSYWYLYEIL